MLKFFFISLSVIVSLSFTSCGGESSKEARELLSKILQFVGIPHNIIVNVCQDSNRDGICGAGELFTKVTLNKGDSVDDIWKKITLTADGRYFLETYNETLPILLSIQDASNVFYDGGAFTLTFDGFENREQNETKELSILQSMVDAKHLTLQEIEAIKTLNNQESQDKFYSTLLTDLETNINTLRAKGLDSKTTMSTNIKEMAEELKDKNITKILPDKINACGSDQACVDKEIKELSDELIITPEERDTIAKENNSDSEVSTPIEVTPTPIPTVAPTPTPIEVTPTPIPTVAPTPTPISTFIPKLSNEEVVHNSNLTLSKTNKGTLLLYSNYQSGNGWITEITIKNTSIYSTIVKVGLYKENSSLETTSFHIYLNSFDTSKFIIEDEKIIASDSSSPRAVRNPIHGVESDAVVFAEANTIIGNTIKGEGYLIIYGLTQYNHGFLEKSPYSNNREDLWKDYRRLSDDCRPGWRDAFETGGMKDGVMQISVNPQKSHTGCGGESISVNTDVQLENFVGVSNDTLEGSAKISKVNENTILPATAFIASEHDYMFLSVEGEIIQYK